MSKIYTVVTEHTTGVQTQVFADADDAVEYAAGISPDTDGSMLPNLSDEVLESFGGADEDAYLKGFYWLRNRYAVVFVQEAALLRQEPVDRRRCIDNGAHLASSRHTPAECPLAEADEAAHDMPHTGSDGPFYDDEDDINPDTCPHDGEPLSTHIGGKPCVVGEPSTAKTVHDLPIARWAHEADNR